MAVSVGTAPDSWGVWFPDDRRQPPWTQFLDEVVVAGYDTIEIGPYGYLPPNPASCRPSWRNAGYQRRPDSSCRTSTYRNTWPAMKGDVAALVSCSRPSEPATS